MEPAKHLNLEDRLISFAVEISRLVQAIPESPSGKYLTGQLIRSGFSPALNYGEARSAESSKDFIHKMKIALKELRETFVSLKILDQIHPHGADSTLKVCIGECNELISIFVKSIQTAEKNQRLNKGN